MTDEQRMEQLSRAYIHAVAAIAKVACEPTSVDDDSVDITLKAAGSVTADALRSPRVEVQLKATASPQFISDGSLLSHRIPRKNYDDLRLENALQRVLMVLVLSDDVTQWVQLSSEELVARRCMHWVNLHGQPEANHDGEKVTVHLPVVQRVTVDALSDMMIRAARKERV
jgi:hypothetical protein